MSTADKGQYKELQYDVRQLGQEMVVGNRIPNEESIKNIITDSKKQIEQLLYGFVYELASLAAEDPEEAKGISYYITYVITKSFFFLSLT
jgi:hypothetical protein